MSTIRICNQCNEYKNEASFYCGRNKCLDCRNSNAKLYRLARLEVPSNYTRERDVWEGIKKRCLNKNSKDYKNYGGRGITICDRWVNSFENFISDMGPKPSLDHWIERENNELGYDPSNCVWATRKEQMRNRTDSKFVKYEGKFITLAELSELTGINYHTLQERLSLGWSDDRLTLPPQYNPTKYFVYNGSNYTLKQLSQLSGISKSTLKKRLIDEEISPTEVINSSSTRLKINRSKTLRKSIVVYDNEEMTLDDLSTITGINIQTLVYRYRQGRQGADLVSPVRGIPTYFYNGHNYSIRELSDLCGVNQRTLFYRLAKLKMRPEDAMATADLRIL